MCWNKIKNMVRTWRQQRADEKARRNPRQHPQRLNPRFVGPNMPRYQPCPECHGDSPRGVKVAAGAMYTCTSCHLQFFVQRPQKHGRRIPVFQHSK